MRTSSYAIYVNLPAQPDHVLLVHGYSGAYDVVARPVAAYLRSREVSRHKPLRGDWTDEAVADTAAAPPSDATMTVLRKRGFLTEQTVEEERAFVASLASKRHAKEVSARPQYILMPTYQCNLRCGYCFQDHMRTDASFSHLLKLMTPAMVERVVTSMTAIDLRHPGALGRPRSVTLFGGEPLLAESRPLIELLVRRLRESSDVQISAITNGTELEHFLDLLGPDQIASVQITIDGPPKTHDQRRIYADGSGSFAQIAANITRALARDAVVQLRINVDKTNVDDLPELAREIAAHGWSTSRGFVAYAAAVHATEDNHDTFNQYALVKRVNELRDRHADMRLIHSPANEVERTIAKILQGQIKPWDAYKSSYCSAHTTMYVIDAFGDIYACWERTGDANIRIGWIDETGVPRFPAATDPDRGLTEPKTRRYLPMVGNARIGDLETWRSRTIATNATCASCRYAFYCGGGCAAEAVNESDGFFTNNCNGFQQKFRVAAAEAFTAYQAGALELRAELSLCGA